MAARPMLAPAEWSLYGAPWLQLVAINGKSDGRKRRKRAKTDAVGCDWLPREVHGKEGVDGSSPSEGSQCPARGMVGTHRARPPQQQRHVRDVLVLDTSVT